MDHRPIERQVESREFKLDDIPPSVIRYMYFVRTYITNSKRLSKKREREKLIQLNYYFYFRFNSNKFIMGWY